MLTSTRRGILYPNPNRSDTADVPRDIGALVTASELEAIYGQGTLAARPVSTSGSPGIQGRFFFATDTLLLYYDFGTGWQTIGASSIPPDNTITGGPLGAGVQIKQSTITHDNIVAGTIRGGGLEIAAASITAADISTTLKPSSGAGAGTEALRALGTAAGTAAAGTHASQHSRTGADPLVISTFISSGTLAARPSTSLVAGMLYTATDQGAGAAGGVTYMYTGAAWLITEGGFHSGDVYSNWGQPGEMRMASNHALYFDNTGTHYIYQPSAGTLQSNDDLVLAGNYIQRAMNTPSRTIAGQFSWPAGVVSVTFSVALGSLAAAVVAISTNTTFFGLNSTSTTGMTVAHNSASTFGGHYIATGGL